MPVATSTSKDIGAWSDANYKGSCCSPRTQLRMARENIKSMKEAAVEDHTWEVLADLRPACIGGWQNEIKDNMVK